MNINRELCTNKYDLKNGEFLQVVDIAENILNRVENYDCKSLGVSDNLSLLGLIAESYPVLKEKEKWDEFAYNILSSLKENIQSGLFDRIALYDGVGELALFTSILVKNSGHFEKLLNTINQYIIVGATNRMLYMERMGKDMMSTSWFDVISGMSGIGNYLLYSNELLEDDEKVKCIKNINKFLVSLAEYKEINGYRVPGWFILGKNQATEDYRKDYPEGSINYSLSHGIVGPLICLTKSIQQGICVEGQKEAISTIVEELLRVKQSLVQDGYLWPGIISYENYIKGQYEQENIRLSWCYGALSNIIAMLDAASILKNKDLDDLLQKELAHIATWDIHRYHLHSPIICHGYAGTAIGFYYLYDRFGLDQYKEKGNELLHMLLDSFNKEYKYGFKDVVYQYSKGVAEKEEKDKLDFLEGTSGIVMTLVSMLKNNADFLPMIML